MTTRLVIFLEINMKKVQKKHIGITVLFLSVILVAPIYFLDLISITDVSIEGEVSCALNTESNDLAIHNRMSQLPQPNITDHYRKKRPNLNMRQDPPPRVNANFPYPDLTAIASNNLDIQDNNNIIVSDYITSFVAADSYQEYTLNRLGDLLDENGYKQEAVDAYDKAIKENKGDIAASLIAIGNIVTKDGNIDDFYDYSLSIINLYPNDNSLYESLADFFRERGAFQQGLLLLENGMQYNSDNDNYFIFYNNYRDFIDNLNL